MSGSIEGSRKRAFFHGPKRLFPISGNNAKTTSQIRAGVGPRAFGRWVHRDT